MAIAGDVYGPFPVTVQGYEGGKTNSVSYSGQIARHALHDSLKVLLKQGNGTNADELLAQMMMYFEGSDKNIIGKFYNGAMPAWPGNMSGRDVALSMLAHGAASNGGFDPKTGYDWQQLFSKFTMGAMAYNQAVDNYLDEKLEADVKPNGKPYKDGAYYTGKEHCWDEAFGYFGAAAHSLTLDAAGNYAIAKRKDMAAADANGDGVVDLKSEMVFQPAYYAASFDKGGKSSYMADIMRAFIDGRELIASANGQNLTDAQRATLKGYAATIEENWEKVLAEATFKYAGSVYKDITAITEAADDDARAKAYRSYAKHWGELKGFSMALQSGRNNLGETATTLNKLIGFGPVTLDNRYVTGVDAEGNFEMKGRKTWEDYQLHMLKVQALLGEQFGLKARAKDQTAALQALADKLDAASNAETD